MKIEYLILNLIIFFGPLLLSFEKSVHYFSQWKYAFKAIVMVGIPFIIWDISVNHRHWWFNSNYTLNFQLLGLPLEEWLFFITVPFSVLFIWEIFSKKTGNPVNLKQLPIQKIIIGLAIPGIILFYLGKEYTGLAIIALSITGIMDLNLKTQIFLRKNTYVYLGIVTLLNLIFNGYLTGRPIVLYNEAYQLNWRIITIPIEDFIYGYSLILSNTILFEKFKR